SSVASACAREWRASSQRPAPTEPRRRPIASSSMQRVSVIGNASSGKSTVARALAARIGVPYVELDALHWGPRWSQATADELRARVEPMLSADAWVIDGMYWRKLGGAVLRRADTVIWVDPPFATMFLRLLRRSLTRIVRRTP